MLIFLNLLLDDENENDLSNDANDEDDFEAIPEPERDAQLEKAYLLEKEDANSGDEEEESDDSDVEKDTTDEPLSKKQKREEEVIHFCLLILLKLTNFFFIYNFRKRK